MHGLVVLIILYFDLSNWQLWSFDMGMEEGNPKLLASNAVCSPLQNSCFFAS